MGTFPFRRTESATVGFALFSATIMIAQQVAGKATRDALFLTYFDVTQLPRAVIIAAIASMLGVLLMSKLLSHYPPSRLVPGTFALSALLFLAEWVLFGINPKVAAIVLYLHMAIFGAILISGFWSVISEQFDPHSAKRTIARIAAAATLGGVLGGLVAERVTALGDVRTMLLVLSTLHLLCVAGVLGVGSPHRQIPQQSDTEVRSGLKIIVGSPYLQLMSALTALVAIIAVLLDYALKAEASARFTSSESLVAFFASFYAIIGVAGFVLQTALGPKVLQRFGIGTTLAVLPATVILGSLLGSVISLFWTATVVRGAQAMLANSFSRSAFEILYTPLPPHRKRPTKTIVDVASDRFGDMLGGGLVLVLLTLLPDLPSVVFVGVGAIAAAVTLYLVRRLQRSYVGQLVDNLQKGHVSLSADQVIDATTQHVLAETSVYSEREILMTRIKALRRAKKSTSDTADDTLPAHVSSSPEQAPHALPLDKETSTPDSPPQASPAATDVERLAAAVADLTSGDTARVRRALISDFMDIRLAPYLIPLLGNDEVAEDARMELRWVVPYIIGQLTDALLDPDLPLLARQRLPGVLEVSHNARAVRALLDGLSVNEFNIRYSCARALERMRSRNPTLRVPRHVVYAAVRREVEVDSIEWEQRNLNIDRTLSVDSAADSSLPPRVNRSLEHVFTILSLVHDREALQLSLHAVCSNDHNLRGTALEYLENVLPEGIRRSLWRQVGVTPRRAKRKRPVTAIINDLRPRETGGQTDRT